MANPKRQLYILCDIEGASGISPENREAMAHGSPAWTLQGRPLITSDVRAVCEAAVEHGIDEIILNDSHDNGHRTPNVLPSELPREVRLVRRPYLPGKPRRMAGGNLYGIVIVGQHAMAGGGGFAPHTITWQFGEVSINGLKVGEIGIELAMFMEVPLLAIIGEQAAVAEAQTLCPRCIGVPVKSLENDWFPTANETRCVIREKTLEALKHHDEMTGLQLEAPFRFTLRPHERLQLDRNKKFFLRTLIRHILFRQCKGKLSEDEVSWETKSIVGGLYMLHAMRAFMRKR